MTARVAEVTAIPCEARWERIFARRPVPLELLRPAAHFRAVPRRGQASLLVRLRTDDGLVGWGEGWGLPTPRAGAAVIEDVLAPLALDTPLEPTAIDRLWERCREGLRALGLGCGVHMEALSGLDLALWDTFARRSAASLADAVAPFTVGSPGRRRCRVYASPVRLHDTAEAAIAEARDLVGRGHRMVKMKLGRDPELDADHYLALREALGPGIAVAVGVNGGWSAAETRRFVAIARDLPPAWIEDPLPQTDGPSGLAELRRRCDVPLATGENLFDEADVAALVAADAVDQLVINLGRIGGIGGLRRVLALTGSGVSVSLHGVGGAALVAASAQVAAAGDLLLETNSLLNPLRDELGAVGHRIEDGTLHLAEGQGIAWDPEPGAMEHWRCRGPATAGVVP